MTSIPKLGIGLPVKNGEKYLRETLKSIRAQTFTDYEVVISDNVSSDQTPAICREFVELDERFHYARLDKAVGVATNFNSIFHQSRTPYFKWVAHDDLMEPTFFEKCMEALEADPSVVLAHPAECEIDSSGEPLPLGWQPLQYNDAERACTRFRYLCWDQPGYPFFGVIRSDILGRTGLQGEYPAVDRVLLAELALHGPFARIPEQLFRHRQHPQRAGSADRHQYKQRNHTPDNPDKISFPHFRLALELARAIRRSPVVGKEGMCCYLQIVRWMVGGAWWNLADDVFFGARQVVRGWLGSLRRSR